MYRHLSTLMMSMALTLMNNKIYEARIVYMRRGFSYGGLQ